MAYIETTARLGVDITSFEKGMAASVASAEKAANQIGKKFSGSGIGTALATALGLNIQNLAEKLVTPFREAAEYAQSLAENTDKMADATERLIASRQNDAQQLDTMLKKVKRLQEDLNNLQAKPRQDNFGPFGIIQRGSAFDKLLGLSASADKDAQKDVAEKSVEIVDTELEIKQQKEKVTAEVVKQVATEKERKKVLEEIAKMDLEKKSAEEQITKLTKEQYATQKQILAYEGFIKSGGELTIEGAKELKALKEKEVELQTRIAELTKKTTDETKKQVEEVKALVIQVKTVGRGDTELSDRELARKQSNLRADIARRQVSESMGTWDPMLSFQRYTLSQLEAEQSLREQTRRNVAAFGNDRAFAMSSLTESRFAEIIGTMSENKKQTDLLERLNRKFEMGVRVIPVGVNGGATTIK